MSYQLPNAKAIKDLFEDLLGRDVTVARGAPIRASEVNRTAAALYVESGVQMAAVIGIDIGLAAAAGAANSLVSRAEAHASAQAGNLSPLLAKNTVDLFENLLGLLDPAGTSPLRLYQTFMPGERTPADVAGQLVALGRRIDADIAVAGYGQGRLSFTLADAPRR